MRNRATILKKLKNANIAEISRRSGVYRWSIYRLIAGGEISITTYEKIEAAIKAIEKEKREKKECTTTKN